MPDCGGSHQSFTGLSSGICTSMPQTSGSHSLLHLCHTACHTSSMLHAKMVEASVQSFQASLGHSPLCPPTPNIVIPVLVKEPHKFIQRHLLPSSSPLPFRTIVTDASLLGSGARKKDLEYRASGPPEREECISISLIQRCVHSLQLFLSTHQWAIGPDNDWQYNHHVLHQQAQWCEISPALLRSCHTIKLVHQTSDFSLGCTPIWFTEHFSGQPRKGFWHRRDQGFHPLGHLFRLGLFTDGPVCNTT